MAKKVRKVKKQKPVTPVDEPQVKGPTVVEAVAPKTSKMTSAELFEMEYSYVAQDLKRVFLLSGVMFILLIGLNLLLQQG